MNPYVLFCYCNIMREMRSMRRFLATMDARMRTRRGERMNAQMAARRYTNARSMLQYKHTRQKKR
ncbi:MAG: hypothetical protein Q4E56_03150 [Pseudomonadota bacterium]|nr:hypothetical protein [Pseudomonadota bacterium]